MFLPQSKKHIVIIFLLLLFFLVGTGIDLYVPSLPAIARYYHVDAHWVRLSVAFYMLGYGLGQIILGIMSDSLGRRRVLIISSIFYIVVCVLILDTSTMLEFNLCRFLQGLGMSGFAVVGRAIVTDCFSGVELAKTMTLISMSFALGPIIGPFIGSYLQYLFSWKAGFYYFSICGLLISILSIFFLPETKWYSKVLKLDQLWGAFSEVISSYHFVSLALLSSLFYGMMVMFSVVAPFSIQNTLGYSVIAYGHFALVLGMAYFLGTLINRIALNYVSVIYILTFGFALAFLVESLFLLMSIFLPLSVQSLLLPVFTLFFLLGFVFPNVMSACLSLFSHIGGTASAVYGFLLGLGVCILSGFVSVFETEQSTLPLAMSYAFVFLVATYILGLTSVRSIFLTLSCRR